MIEGASGWVLAVNLVIWTGLFLYLLHIDRQVRRREDSSLRAGAPGRETER